MCYKCDNLSAYLLSVTSINNNTHNMRQKYVGLTVTVHSNKNLGNCPVYKLQP